MLKLILRFAVGIVLIKVMIFLVRLWLAVVLTLVGMIIDFINNRRRARVMKEQEMVFDAE